MDKDFLEVIFGLLPGFVAAWVFFGLTAHPRRDVSERVIQALVFTAIVRVLTVWLRWLCVHAGRVAAMGVWTQEVETGWSIVIAVVFGLVASAMANNDLPHAWLREDAPWKGISRRHWRVWRRRHWRRCLRPRNWWAAVRSLKITSKHSYPSQWVSVFQREGRHVVLMLKDGRRLQGWPREYPDGGGDGHFVLQCAAWLLDTGEKVPLPQIQAMIIPAKRVAWVETLLTEVEVGDGAKDLQQAQKPLYDTVAAVSKTEDANKDKASE